MTHLFFPHLPSSTAHVSVTFFVAQAMSPMTPSKRCQDDSYDDMYPSHPINLFNPDFPPPPAGIMKKPKLDVVSIKNASGTINTHMGGRLAYATPPPTAKFDIPSNAVLYHLAVSAHRASTQHLQQVFVPKSISIRPSGEYTPLSAGCLDQPSISYRYDPQAFKKTLSLLLLSLDLLRIGTATKDLSEREEVAFGLEFGLVAAKIIEVDAKRSDEKGKQAEMIDLRRLKHDAKDVVANAVSLRILGTPFLQWIAVARSPIQLPEGIDASA
jgi:hypothetical protein